MEYFSKIALGSQVAFVLCMIDDFTGQPVGSDSFRVEYQFYSKAPMFKQDGFVVFCGLPEGDYGIDILSEKYFNEKVTIRVHSYEEPSVTYILLKPRPSYSFRRDTALLRFALLDEKKRPAEGTVIKATVLSKEAFKGKIAKAPVEKGDNEFYITSVTGRLKVGDQLFLADENGNEEVITIGKQLEGLRHYQTRDPFQFNHPKGNLLMPAMETLTDGRGETVVYFHSLPVNKFSAVINVNFEGRTIIKQVKMEEGKTIDLKKVRI